MEAIRPPVHEEIDSELSEAEEELINSNILLEDDEEDFMPV